MAIKVGNRTIVKSNRLSDYFVGTLTEFPNSVDVVKEHQLSDNGDTVKIGASFNDVNGDISIYVKFYNPNSFVEQEAKQYRIPLFNDEPKSRISLPLALVGYLIVEVLELNGIGFDGLGEGIISVPLELNSITTKIWISDDGKFISISRKIEEETVGDLGAKYGF